MIDGSRPTALAGEASAPSPERAGSVDLAIATPVYVDLTFVGLESLPGLGDERFAGDLVNSPGGGAITALGAARLGLDVAIAAPVGDDDAGELLARAFAQEGIVLAPGRVRRTPVTMVMPHGGDRAMVTYDPGARASREAVAALTPRAVGVSLGELDLVPDGVRAFVSCGDDDARAFAGRPPEGLEQVETLLVNLSEALRLTERSDPEEAVRALGRRAPTAVVTLGPHGAIAVHDGELIRADGVAVDRVVDTTGAGDCFIAAWIWGALRGIDLETRLRWAGLYAALSVTVSTGAAGAGRLDMLLEEGARRGLPPLPSED